MCGTGRNSHVAHMAREFFNTERHQDGIIGFDKLLDQYPNSWRAWRDLGDGYLKTGNRSKALACYEKGLALNQGYDYFRDKIAELRKP